MIAEGRVSLDGKVLDTPATLLRSLNGVTVDGNPVEAAAPARLFVYHKPPGLLVTERDPAGRPTIYDRLPQDLPRVVPVGRLDLATEGLLLLTTDGGLKRTLELPATGVERAYRARAYGEITQAMLEDLMQGVEIEGIRYGPINANLERRTGANVWIELILTEGKNREVRRVLEYLGLQVSRLIRTRYGPFILGDLPAGAVGEVRQHDLVAFTKSLKEGKSSDVRVEAVEPRTASRSARSPEKPSNSDEQAPRRSPAHAQRKTPSRHPGENRGPSSSQARIARPTHAATTNERAPRANTAAARAVRSDSSPAAPPRAGFRAAKAATDARSARSARSATFAERSQRTRAEDRDETPARAERSPARPGPAGGRGRPARTPTSGDAPLRQRDKSDDSRPGRTGPRAARPGQAARPDARGGSAGGWVDRPAPGQREDRPRAARPDAKSHAAGPRSANPRGADRNERPSPPARVPRGDSPGRPKTGGFRSKPGQPRRPDGPPRGKR